MTKSALFLVAGAILCTSAATQAQRDSHRCSEAGCTLSQHSGNSYQPRITAGDRFANERVSDYDGARCRDGQCDVNSPHSPNGCENGQCEVDSRRSRERLSSSFPYLSEAFGGTGRSPQLDNPFRRAGQNPPNDPNTGRRDPRPVPTRFQPTSFETRRPITQVVAWNTNIQRAIDQAAREKRRILVQVSAPWCPHCKRMKNETYTNQQLTNLINERFVAIAVDADQQRDFVEQMGIRTLPTTLIVGADLRVLNRLQGFQSAQQLMQTLSR